MSTALRSLFAGALLAGFCLTFAAHTAADTDADSQGRAHLREARALHADGDYESALAALARAWIVNPAPELLVHMAAAQARLNAPDKAATLLARYLIASKGTLSAEREAAVLEAMDELRTRAQANKIEDILKKARSSKDSGRLDEALNLYDKTLKYVDRPEIWLERADTALLAEKNAVALESYLRYRAGARAAGILLRADIAETVQRLYPMVARIEIECPIVGATIEVDGEERGTTPLVEPIFVEPSLHNVVVKKGEKTLLRTSVESVAGRPVSLFVPTDARSRN